MKPGLKRQQSGVVLIVTLVILIVLTLLGTSSIQMTGVSQRVAQNSVDTSVALRSAEAAIQVAEAVIEGDTNLADYEANANGKYMAHVVGEEPRWEDNSNWDGVSSVTVDYSDGDQQPLYMIEFIKTVLNDDDRLNMDNVGGGAGADGTQVFRITALGTGKTASAKVLLQSTYGKKF